MVSKPTRRVWLGSGEIAALVRGGYGDAAAGARGDGKRDRGLRDMGVKALTRPGECLFVSTDRGVLEARECVERKVGGMLLCRVV